jgi:hypothetical protein
MTGQIKTMRDRGENHDTMARIFGVESMKQVEGERE